MSGKFPPEGVSRGERGIRMRDRIRRGGGCGGKVSLFEKTAGNSVVESAGSGRNFAQNLPDSAVFLFWTGLALLATIARTYPLR